MYIESLKLRNFKCFGEIPEVIELQDDLTVFVGANGSGKTSILNALQRLFGPTSAERRLTRSDVHFGPNEVAGSEPADKAADDPFTYVQSKEIEIEVTLAFPELEDQDNSVIPEVFNAMSASGVGQPLKAKIRLEATWQWGIEEDDIEQSLYWITSLEDVPFGDDDIAKIPLKPNERRRIQIRYLPATRDSAAVTRSALKELLSWLEKFGDWSGGQAPMNQQWEELQALFDEMPAIREVTQNLTQNWRRLFDGPHLSEAGFVVLSREIQKALKDLSVSLKNGADGRAHSISELSEGQASLFYVALVFTLLKLDDELAHERKEGFKEVDELRPWFTILILEEPENHLSPFYLSRMIRLMLEFADRSSGMGILTTHSPGALRRVKPEQVRYVRHCAHNLNSAVRSIPMPEKRDEAHKFIYEAVRSHPELYFSKLVILGEGRSEEIVLPKLAAAWNPKLELDPAFVAFVPLGGRHVNHFWKLLEALQIPYVTLLDWDLGRYQAGAYRLKYAVNQLYAIGREREGIADPRTFDQVCNPATPKTFNDWWQFVNTQDVFYSIQLDLDMMMITAFEEQYLQIADLQELGEVADYEKSVFGKGGRGVAEYPPEAVPPTAQQLAIYDKLFKKGSKPVSHIEAIELVSDADLRAGCPTTLRDLFSRCCAKLGIPNE
ncbi:hypothetical protein E1162_15095 [Rhodobacteraceae bacterium RKSG542]|uniref:ATP-dependent nuclease n=1 Tax=Pseudovibrio flavus TaxID=2529854 RepID=UPI0012BB4D52|nr:AAA family ATPase [Pseudovibrio flavus]MTI18570.1 hypothetical protein [Pseudovibrio flavus]